MTTRYSIVVVGVVGDTAEVSTSFLGGVLRLQQKLAVSKDTAIAFEFRHSVKDAIEYFLTKDADRLVIVDSLMGIESDWILKRHPASMDTVVAAYPLRDISWDRVSSARQNGETDPQRLRKASYTYNFTPTTNECLQGSYMEGSNVQAKIVSLSRQGARDFLASYCPYTKCLDTAVVDIGAKAVNAGPFDFVGCIGSRLLKGARDASGNTLVTS